MVDQFPTSSHGLENESKRSRSNSPLPLLPPVICTLFVLLAAAFTVAAENNGQPASNNDDAIINPYYTTPRWRLWTEDQTPVPYKNMRNPRQPKVPAAENTFAPPAVADRLYPIFPEAAEGGVFPTLQHLDDAPAVAGFWDDCYVTLDFAHTRFRTAWSVPDVSINLRGQFVDVPYGMANAATRMSLGTNFTSQSFARRGRHIVDDTLSNEQTERDFFFANCIRATPAHISYEDKAADQVHDTYDGLFAHSYQSVGQSGSETRALTKMMIAGGCMPRETKDLLKQHGAYAIALLTIFKAALPYTDSDGDEVPYENELRHRPAYSSDGAVGHIHFCPANPHYHGYNETKHLQRMIDMTRGMDVAPPVAILKLVDISVDKDGKKVVERSLTDDRVQSVCKTGIRIWGQPGETITARIDVRDSYDLQNRDLTYEWHAVYPNHQNVKITEDDEDGVWRITVAHDEKLPKGRIPVMLVARNGSLIPSNPAFVNFYWPEPDERSDWGRMGPRGAQAQEKVYEVTKNKRPIVDPGMAGDTIWARPGDTIRMSLKTEDPEGYPVTIYRRPGEAGVIQDGQFSFDVPANDAGGVRPVHLIFSDGTGGYTGKRVKVIVSQESPELPDGWHATTIGTPSQAGTVEFTDETFHLTGVAGSSGGRSPDGMFAYRKVSGDIDWVCRVEDLIPGTTSRDAGISLMIREQLHERARYASTHAFRTEDDSKSWSAQFQSRNSWNAWSTKARNGGEQYDAGPLYLRSIRRGGWCAGYVSPDGKQWEQIGAIRHGMADEVLIGLALTGASTAMDAPDSRPRATCTSPVQQAAPIPLVTVEGKNAPQSDDYIGAVKITLDAGGADTTIVYTLDGQDPTSDSPAYADPVSIEQAGRHELRARVLQKDALGDVVSLAIQIREESSTE